MNTIKLFEYDIVKEQSGMVPVPIKTESVRFEFTNESGTKAYDLIIGIHEDKIHIWKSGFYNNITIEPLGVNRINIY